MSYSVKGRLLETGNSTSIALWSMDEDVWPLYRFGTQRSDEIPDEVDVSTGDVGLLPIQQNKSILESAFFVLYPKGIIGFITGMYAPRATQLRGYFKNVLGGEVDLVLLEALSNTDMNSMIEEINRTRLKRIVLKYNREAPDRIMSLDETVKEVMRTVNAQDPDSKTNTIAWGDGRVRRDSQSRKHLFGRLAKAAIDPQNLVYLDALEISYYDPEVRASQTVNLLDKFILGKKYIKKEKGRRNVDPVDARNGITEVYQELKDAIDSAESMVLKTWLKKDSGESGKSTI